MATGRPDATPRTRTRAETPSGSAVEPEWTEYTDFLEQGCDAAFFIGMHAMAGTTDGMMSHTVSGRDWWRLTFNGQLAGETAINAALCGTWGCPVLLVTGDTATCAEATELLGSGLTTVAVKRGIGQYSARNVAPRRVRELIEAGAKCALADLKAVGPYDPGRPCEIVVDFNHVGPLEKYRHRQGVELTGPRRNVSRADDWWSAWKQFAF